MRYDNRFGYYGACYLTNDNGGDNKPQGGGDNKPNNDGGKEPPWKAEFGDEFDPDKAWQTIQNQRREERRLKGETEKLGAKVKEFEDANKTEVEKLQSENEGLKKRIGELEGQISQAAISTQVAEIAKRLGAVYPEDIYALVSGRLEIKEGKATNIEDVVKDLAQSRPMLFQGSNIDQNKNTSNGGNSGQSMSALIRRASGRGN